MAMGRPYHQGARAEKTQQTRAQIIAAGASLYGASQAPPSVADVANTAGVSRPTVYAHFSDTQELMLALTSHLREIHSPPDIRDWEDIEEPRDRTEAALTAVYGQWEAHGAGGMPEGLSEAETSIVSIYGDSVEEVSRRRLGVTRLALSFETWRLLRSQGLSQEESVELMTDLVVRTP